MSATRRLRQPKILLAVSFVYNILTELRIPTKLVKLIKKRLNKTYSKSG